MGFDAWGRTRNAAGPVSASSIVAEPRECADVPVSGCWGGGGGERTHVDKVTYMQSSYGTVFYVLSAHDVLSAHPLL